MVGSMKNALWIIMIILFDVLFGILNIKIGGKSFANISLDSLSAKGGRYITSSGELKVLVVFAKFKDDTSFHPFWPANSYPSEMNNFIDSSKEVGSTHFLNLTNYYKQMPSGKFSVTGKAIGVETPFPINHYIRNNGQYPLRDLAITDILKVVDDSIDYHQFDNWTYFSDYNQINVPDGIVDMIVVIWRGLVFRDQWNGDDCLGGGSEIWVENHQEKIRMGYGGNPVCGINGSGVTVQYWGARSRERNFKVVIHEIAHWLIQAEHPYSYYLHTFWGMLTLAREGICANSFERDLLGWINPTLIEDTTLATEVNDYITTSTTYKYQLKNGPSNEHYYFENHQKLSIYDDVTSNINDKGIFILHFLNDTYNGDCVRILTSDGFWDWESPDNSDCWGNDLPAFRKKSVNRNGFGNRDKIRINNTYCGFIFSYIDDQGEVECNDWLHGYGFKNSFDTTFNDVFSPWSNPPAKTCNNQLTNFSMEILSQIGPIISVRFKTVNAFECKPSKPPLGTCPNESFDKNDLGIIRLTWGSDNWDKLPIDPDINYSQLQMKIDSSDWKTIYSGAERFWSDSNYAYNEIGEISVSFRVRVRDNQNKWSRWSNVYEARKSINNITSLDNQNLIKLLEFQLNQNNPNPFNNTTVIRYSIPKEGFVTLKVYDTIGQEVVTLVNEIKPAGLYKVNFNAQTLSSGIYLYKLSVGPLVETKKMVFLK
jgi:M6 family metalloprotease-like protein